MPTFITRQDISPATASSWQVIDVSSYLGADAGNVSGVMLKITCPEASNEYTVGCRMSGSTDNYSARIQEDLTWNQYCIGVADDKIEVFVENTSVLVNLEAYFLSSEAVFFKEANSISLTQDSAYHVVDLSAYTGTDTGSVAFFQLYNDDTSAAEHALQISGSTTDIVAEPDKIGRAHV